MKAVVVVEPGFLRSVEDDKVEVVMPDATVEEVVAMKRQLVALLEDEREDVITTFSSFKIYVVSVEKVRDIVSA